MLGISLRSVERLKSEVRDIKHDMIEKKRKIDKENEAVEKHELEVLSRLRKIRARSSSSSSSSSTLSTTTRVVDAPIPRPPQRLVNSGRSRTLLTEQQQETIR